MAVYQIITWNCGKPVEAIYRRRSDAAIHQFRLAVDRMIDAESVRDRPSGWAAYRKACKITPNTAHCAWSVSLGDRKVSYTPCDGMTPYEVDLGS